MGTNEENTNYLRLTMVSLDLCRCVCWEVLKCNTPPSRLKAKLSNMYRPIGGPCANSIYFECNNTGIPDENTFDVSALYAIIRAIPAVSAPTHGWGSTPTAGDIGVGDDIERIRLMRNNRIHAKEAKLSAHEFGQEISEFRSIFKRMDGLYRQDFANRLVTMETTDLDPERRKAVIHELEKQRAAEQETREIVEKLRENQEKALLDVSTKVQDIKSDVKEATENQEKALLDVSTKVQYIKSDVKEATEKQEKALHDVSTKVQDIASSLASGVKEVTELVMREPIDVHANLRGQRRLAFENMKGQYQGFIKTRAYTKANNILEDGHWVVISGVPGDGKTAIGVQLMVKHEADGFEPLVLSGPEDWKQLVAGTEGCDEGNCKKQIVLIDDMFGSINADSQCVSKWMSEIKLMHGVMLKRGGKLLVICTSRKHILFDIQSKLSRFPCFDCLSIADMTDDDCRLTATEKTQIIQCYIRQHSIGSEIITGSLQDPMYIYSKRIRHNQMTIEDSVEEIVKIQTPHGFPHCAFLFCSDINFRTNGIEFFRCPISTIGQEIVRFRDVDRTKYCALLLILLSEKVSKATLLNANMKDGDNILGRALVLAGLQSNTPRRDILDAMRSLTGVYVASTGNEFHFNHPSIYEAVALSYLRDDPEQAVDTLQLSTLTSLSKCQGYRPSDGAVVILDPSCYIYLDARLTHELNAGHSESVCKHQAWSDKEFIKVWTDNHMGQIDTILETSASNENQFGLLPALAFCNHDQVISTILDRLTPAAITRFRDNISHALVCACRAGVSREIVEMLIHHGADTNYADYCYIPEREVYEPIFDSYSLSEVLQINACSPLHVSVAYNNIHLVDCLLSNGAKADEVLEVDVDSHASVKISLLECAIVCGVHKEHLPSALDCLTRHSTDGSSALHCIVACIAIDDDDDTIITTINMLVYVGCDVNSRDEYGSTPLELAARNFFCPYYVIDSLVRNGSDCTVASKYGSSVLHQLLAELDMECTRLCPISEYELKTYKDKVVQSVPLFIKNGCDINGKDTSGKTPLMCVASNVCCPYSVIKDLMENGSDCTAVDNESRSVLHHLINISNLDVCEDSEGVLRDYNDKVVQCVPMFIKKGCDKNGKNKYGQTLLMLAARNMWFPYALIENLVVETGTSCTVTDEHGMTVLHYLVQSVQADDQDKGIECITLFTKKGCDINGKCYRGRTPLMLAAGNMECPYIVIKRLVDLGADCIIADDDSMSVLHHLLYLPRSTYMASVRSHTESVPLFTKNGCSVNGKDRLGRTPLLLAAGNIWCPYTVIKTLMDIGSDCKAVDKCGKTVLHHLLSSSDRLTYNDDLQRNIQEKVAQCVAPLCRNGCDINGKDENGVTALMLAAGNIWCPYTVIKTLMDIGSDCKAVDKCGKTVLHHLLSSSDRITYNDDLQRNYQENVAQCVAPLCRNGCDINGKDENGVTALMLAAGNIWCPYTLIKTLMHIGSDITAVDKDGKSVLHHLLTDNSILKRKKHEKIVQCVAAFCGNGCDINGKDNSDVTPLMVAAGHTSCTYTLIKTLVDFGSDCTAVDKDGKSVLHHLLTFPYSPMIMRGDDLQRNNHENVFQCVCEKGCDINGKDNSGVTPLIAAAGHMSFISHSVIEILVELGSDCTIVDRNGRSVLHHLQEHHPITVSLKERKIYKEKLVRCASMLCKNGCDRSGKDSMGDTPLILAAANGYLRGINVDNLLQPGCADTT